MSSTLDALLNRIVGSDTVFAKSLSPNDTGLTGGHQCGIYIPKQSSSLIFDQKFERGQNHERYADIIWNEDVSTHSKFTYYGVNTRNEYRITHFGRGFPFLKPEHTGDVVVICKESNERYFAYLLSTDEDIQGFLDAFSIPITALGSLVKDQAEPSAPKKESLYEFYYAEFNEEFPSTQLMAVSAQEVDDILNSGSLTTSPDDLLLRWIDTEYELFRYIENRYYKFVVEQPAESLESFVKTGLEITNRRKARAGKSLEHHLREIFSRYDLSFTPQAKTELNKRPDFIFPSQEAYSDSSFPAEKLTFLGAKTTCKDRWRQVLNEANRIEKKYLFTLQQGVSPNQLEEMHEEKLVLVVPKKYHKYYPKTEYESVISLEEFIRRVKDKQERGI